MMLGTVQAGFSVPFIDAVTHGLVSVGVVLELAHSSSTLAQRTLGLKKQITSQDPVTVTRAKRSKSVIDVATFQGKNLPMTLHWAVVK